MPSWMWGRCLGAGGTGKIFQNRKVSSPAPVTIVLPSGFIAR